MSDVHEKLGDDGEYARWIASEARKEGRRRMTEVIEHPALTGREVVVPAQPVDALTDFASPLGGVHRASQLATELARIVKEKRLSVKIGQGEHLRIEAWLTLGALCGVTATTEWTKRDEEGFSARANVVRLATGEVIGAAESRCDASERNWTNRDPHALMSMAQTRAASKAMAQVLRWIVILSGYEGTPYEEMPRGSEEDTRPMRSGPVPQPEPERRSPVAQAAPQPTDFLDTKLEFGKHKGKTWREMSEGSVDGERHSWLRWISEQEAKDARQRETQRRARLVLEGYEIARQQSFEERGDIGEPSPEWDADTTPLPSQEREK